MKLRRVLDFAAAILFAAPLFIPGNAPWPRVWPWCYPAVAIGIAIPLAVLGFRKAFHFGDLGGDAARFGPGDIAFLVGFPLFALFVGNNRALSSGDNEATRQFGLVVLSHHTFDYASLPRYQTGDLPYALTRAGGRVLPAFPLGTGVLALPHAFAAKLAQGERTSGLALMGDEKHCAALLMAATACILFGGIARIAGTRAAWATTVVFGLCTPVMTTTSQALWSTTGSVFCLVVALTSLLMSEAPGGAAAGGAALAAAVLCRPTAVLPGMFVLIALAARSRTRAAIAAAGFAVVFVAGTIGTAFLYRAPLGPYVGGVNSAASSWRFGVEGIAGVLVSPSRGLLVYLPFVLFAGVAGRLALRRKDGTFPLVLVGAASIATETLLAGCYRKWFGGDGIGPRLLSEASPFFALLLLPLWKEGSLSKWPRRLLLAAVCWSGVVQILGAFNSRASEWNQLLDSHPEVLWSWRDSQLAATLVPGWRSSIPPEPPGREDAGLTANLDNPALDETVHGDLLARGWGRIPGEDLEVVLYIDGRQRTPREARRVARPDVLAAVPSLGDASRAGFEVVLPFAPADAGSHRIVAVFRTSDGRVRHFPFREFTWKP